MANLHLVTGYGGSDHVTAADDGSLNAAIFGEGQYVLKRGNRLAASVINSNTVRILDGDILMHGRHVRLNEGNYVDLTIENGAQGMKRIDLIVCRYTKNTSTGVENADLVVIKGTPVDSSPELPAITEGDILNNQDVQSDMPLYSVLIDGLTVNEPILLATAVETALAQIAELLLSKVSLNDNGKIDISYLPVSGSVSTSASKIPTCNAVYQVISNRAKFASGTYIGDGTQGHIISLGFKPKCFILRAASFGYTDEEDKMGIFLEDEKRVISWTNPTTSFQISATNNGFNLNSPQTSPRFNEADEEYQYVAWG